MHGRIRFINRITWRKFSLRYKTLLLSVSKYEIERNNKSVNDYLFSFIYFFFLNVPVGSTAHIASVKWTKTYYKFYK